MNSLEINSNKELINISKKNQCKINEICFTVNNINHLESILIDKKKHRITELDTIKADYDSAIQSYSSVIVKLLS
jgi:hypothetical protein